MPEIISHIGNLDLPSCWPEECIRNCLPKFNLPSMATKLSFSPYPIFPETPNRERWLETNTSSVSPTA